MIEGLPLQTQSPGPHLRGWGCYAHCLAAMAMDQCGEIISPDDLRDLVVAAIGAGIILDNNLPTDGSEGKWYRVFVSRPVDWVNLVGYHLGHTFMDCAELSRDSIYTVCPTNANYLMIENADEFGSHFTLGVINLDWSYTETYNPWPGLPLNGIRTVRRWEVKR